MADPGSSSTWVPGGFTSSASGWAGNPPDARIPSVNAMNDWVRCRVSAKGRAVDGSLRAGQRIVLQVHPDVSCEERLDSLQLAEHLLRNLAVGDVALFSGAQLHEVMDLRRFQVKSARFRNANGRRYWASRGKSAAMIR